MSSISHGNQIPFEPREPHAEGISNRFAAKRIVLFLVTLALLTAVANVVAAQTESPVVGSLMIMWSPGAAAIIASLLNRRSLKEIGWRPWPVKWLAAGWIAPMLYAFPAYALIWSFGLGSVPNPTFLERARLTLGMPEQPDWLVIIAAFGFISIVNLLPAMILALGEEIGWRGYLVPELTKSVGFRKACIISGAIWGCWHLPGVLGGSYGHADTPLAFRLVCFITLVLGTAVILAWLRMKSGSIWPVAIMHATHNGIVQAFFDRITADTGQTRYFVGEFGIAMVPFILLLAGYCWFRRPVHKDRHADRISPRH